MVIEYFLDWIESAPVNKRIEAASALVKAFLRSSLSEEEREETEAAITTLLEDASPDVRMAIAESFGAFPAAPRHIISALGQDSLDISIVVLSQSPVFHDVELIEIATHGDERQQVAIACRPWVSERVIDVMVSHSCRDACYALLSNSVASLTEQNLHALAVRFGSDTEIRNFLLEREAIAAETRVHLVEQLGSQLAQFVEKKKWTCEAKAGIAVSEACDRASIMFAARAEEADVRRIVKARIEAGRLTVAYLIRSVCMGNISLVAHAFSELSGVKFARVETVLTRDNKAAFRAIYDRAGLPDGAFMVFDVAISKWRDLLKRNATINPARLPFLVMKEVLATCQSGKSQIVDELLVLLRRLASETARENAKSKAVEIISRGKPDKSQLQVAADVELPAIAPALEFEDQVLRCEPLVIDSFDPTNAGNADTQKIEPELPAIQDGDAAKLPAGDAGFIGFLTDEDYEEIYAGVTGFPEYAPQAGDLSRAA